MNTKSSTHDLLVLGSPTMIEKRSVSFSPGITSSFGDTVWKSDRFALMRS